MQNGNVEDVSVSSEREKKPRKTLVVEIDITDFDDCWTIDITKSQLWLSSGNEKQIIAKRTSRDDLIYVPHLEEENFIKSITIETHES